jgi:hypothetical protein
MTLRFPAEAPIQFSLNQAVTTNVSQRGSEMQTMIGSEKLKSADKGWGAIDGFKTAKNCLGIPEPRGDVASFQLHKPQG